jgi:DNA-binding GntR family transcriptional regulator
MGNTAEFIRTDVAFHYELNVITRNPIFAAIHETLVEWLIDQRTTTIHMPDADRFSVRDHTAIYEAVAAHDPMRAFHEMSSHLRLISQLYHESKRLSEAILRNVTRDVAARIDREMDELWSSSRSSRRADAKRIGQQGRRIP